MCMAEGSQIQEQEGAVGQVPLVVPDHGCGRQVLGRVSLRVSFGMFLVVSARGWKVSEDVLALLLELSMWVLHGGMG